MNVAKLVEFDPDKWPKALVWNDERVRAWRLKFEREVEAARAVAGTRPVNVFKIWLSMPMPSRVMVWTPAQTGTFLDRAHHHRLYAMCHLVAVTGLRRSEVARLEWSDVNLDAQD
ncbi:tyrosine-type recombinase/integrase [Actinomadura rudentiformis]|uniref:Tyrosine-type recombinase/integrase n=1 Tax=Actinomadura rudentiformis TaxID=359158 RepID=A0A6H9YM37_9ACTN|nr:tyrosine-type recombinase/integrase [Actinomadura rudentiformis]KAB2347772.1 tyrosine-type recombinase/integrase [Actinomadura rudentiformis]